MVKYLNNHCLHVTVLNYTLQNRCVVTSQTHWITSIYLYDFSPRTDGLTPVIVGGSASAVVLLLMIVVLVIYRGCPRRSLPVTVSR